MVEMSRFLSNRGLLEGFMDKLDIYLPVKPLAGLVLEYSPPVQVVEHDWVIASFQRAANNIPYTHQSPFGTFNYYKAGMQTTWWICEYKLDHKRENGLLCTRFGDIAQKEVKRTLMVDAFPIALDVVKNLLYVRRFDNSNRYIAVDSKIVPQESPEEISIRKKWISMGVIDPYFRGRIYDEMVSQHVKSTDDLFPFNRSAWRRRNNTFVWTAVSWLNVERDLIRNQRTQCYIPPTFVEQIKLLFL